MNLSHGQKSGWTSLAIAMINVSAIGRVYLACMALEPCQFRSALLVPYSTVMSMLIGDSAA